jgi:hypothetical protein
MPNDMKAVKGNMPSQNQPKVQGPGFKTAPNGAVIASSIQALTKLTVDPSMRVAMTNAGAKLVIEIGTGGTSVFLADARTGSTIGGPEDLQKMNGIRAFITRERKEASSLDISNRLKTIAYFAATFVEGTKGDGWTTPPLDSGYLAAVKPLISVLETLEVSERKVRANKNATNRTIVEEFLINQLVRTKRAYLDFMEALTSNEDVKGFLPKALFKHGVSSYMHAKLINKSLVIEPTQDLNRVVFPADPSKGLTFTLRESRDADFLRKQGPIIDRSKWVFLICSKDSFVRAMAQLDREVELDDEANALVQSVMKGRLYVIPHLEDLRYLTSAGGKVKSNGWKFPVVNMSNPGNRITAFGLAVLRAYCANLQYLELVEDYYSVVAPGRVSKAAVTPLNNFYVQWEKTFSEGGKCELHAKHFDGTGDASVRAQLVRWVSTELRLAAAGPIQKSLYMAIGLTESGEERSSGSAELTALASAKTAISPCPIMASENFLREPSAVEKQQALEWAATVFPPKAVKKEKARGEAAMTKLTPRSRELVDRVKRLSPHVASSLVAWLRGFQSERLQAAAATLAIAKFDEIFIHEGVDETESLGDYDRETETWADQVQEDEG